jgi:hypothetical protein
VDDFDARVESHAVKECGQDSANSIHVGTAGRI